MVSNKITNYRGFNTCNFLIGIIILSVVGNRVADGCTDSSLKIPQFIDAHPLNQTLSRGSQVVFQCRVLSEEYPTIKWFRRLSNFKFDGYKNIHSTIYYKGQAYELLTSAHAKSISKNVYLSKVILNTAQQQDEGFYACVAISLCGYYVQEAYLKVNVPDIFIDFTEYWSDYEEENVVLPTDPKEFWLLFLIPVSLALLPLLVLLSYAIYKRYQNYSLKKKSKYLEPNDQQCMLKT